MSPESISFGTSPVQPIAARGEKSLPDRLARLEKLYQLSMTLSGDPLEIFRQVAFMIAELLDVKVVCLSEVVGDRLRFLAVYVDGKVHLEPGGCPLDVTPCATVEQSKDLRIYDDVARKFPRASFLAEHDAFAYCGFPSIDHDGNVVAVTCLLDDRPHEFSAEDAALLRIFGQRIGMEIERSRQIAVQKKSDQALEDYRLRLEHLVEQRTAQLSSAVKELEAFCYSVSHDLRAPLRSIDGFSKALLEDCADRLDDAGRDYLDRVRAQAKRMDLLIDDLLKLSRVSRAEMKYGEVDLSALAREVVDSLGRHEPGRRVAVRIEPGMTAYGDEGLLRVLLATLLDNAWKYTARAADASIQFDGSTNELGEREFRVADNGAGFDMRYAARLFTPFQRLHSVADFPGTGIGLATAQRVINRHGGRIWGEGSPGCGATFRFVLPDAAASTTSATTAGQA